MSIKDISSPEEILAAEEFVRQIKNGTIVNRHYTLYNKERNIMPTRSEAQRKLIFGKRNKYKTKKATPDKDKWIWDKGFENKGDLPEKIEENIMSTFKKYMDIVESHMVPEYTKSGIGPKDIDNNRHIEQYSIEKMEQIIHDKRKDGANEKEILKHIWNHGFPNLPVEDQKRLRTMME